MRPSGFVHKVHRTIRYDNFYETSIAASDLEGLFSTLLIGKRILSRICSSTFFAPARARDMTLAYCEEQDHEGK